MNAVHLFTRAGRALRFLLAIAAMIALAVPDGARAQNVAIGTSASTSGTGILNVKGNITNAGVAAATKLSGTVNLNGATQTIGTAGNGALNFDSLKSTGTATDSIFVDASTDSALDVQAGGAAQFWLGAHKLTLTNKIANSGSAANPYVLNTAGSQVVYSEASGTQSIYGTAYAQLAASGAAAYNLQGNASADTVAHTGGALSVNHNLTVNKHGAFTTVADVTGTSTLQLNGSTPDTIAAITTLTSGSIINGSTGALAVTTLAGNTGGVVSAAGGAVNIGTATNGNGTLEANGASLTIGTLSGNSGSIRALATGGNLNFTNAAVNAGIISDTGTSATMTFGAALTNNTGGKIFAGNGTTSISSIALNAGKIGESGTGGITVTGGTLNADTIEAGSGGTLVLNGSVKDSGASALIRTKSAPINFASGVTNMNGAKIISKSGALTFSAALANGGGTLELDSVGSAVLNADFASAGTLTFADSTTVTYAGSTTTVQPVTYGNLTLGGSSNKGANNNFNVGGNLALGTNLTMSPLTDALTLTSATAAVTGKHEVDGTVKRSHTFAANTYYAFNSDSVGFALNTTGANTIGVTMAPDSTPTNFPNNKYVDRNYTVSGLPSGQTLTSLALIYQTSELNGLTQAKLAGESYNGSWAKVSNAGYTRVVDSSAYHGIRLTGIATPTNSVTQFAMAAGAIYAVHATDWATTSTWDDGVVPGSGDDVIDTIATSGGVTVNSGSQAAGTLTLGSGTQTGLLTVNAGSLAVSGGVTFVSASTLTLNGAMTAGGTVTLVPTSTLSLSSAGHLTITTLGNDIVVNGTLINNGLIDVK